MDDFTMNEKCIIPTLSMCWQETIVKVTRYENKVILFVHKCLEHSIPNSDINYYNVNIIMMNVRTNRLRKPFIITYSCAQTTTLREKS